MRNKLVVSLVFTALFLAACSQNNEKNKAVQDIAAGTHKVTVRDVLQAESYTYLNVSENGRDFWIAITKEDVRKGETLYYVGGLEMRNFESKDLGKTFDVVYFVDSISREPVATPGMAMSSPHGKPKTAQDQQITVTPAQGGITIAELYANRKKYDGKTVHIRGKVVKVNEAIMGRNWVHIQDGTNDNGNYDLTVTTNDNVRVGDVVTFEGKIALDKDFTAGYVYDVIMEEATGKVEKSS